LKFSLAKADTVAPSAVTERETEASKKLKILHPNLNRLSHLPETPWTHGQPRSPSQIRCQDPYSSSWMRWLLLPV